MRCRVPCQGKLTSFDLYLVTRPGEEYDRAALLQALRSHPFLHPQKNDPDGLVYHHGSTGAFFLLYGAPGLLRPLRRRAPDADASAPEDIEDAEEAEGEEAWAEETPDETDATNETTQEAPQEPEAGTSEGGGAPRPTPGAEESGGSEEEEGPRLEMPPITISIPFFRPRFFLAEAVGLASVLARAANLVLDHWASSEERPHGDAAPAGGEPGSPSDAASPPGGGHPPPPTLASLLEAWLLENRRAAAHLKCHDQVATWSPDEALKWSLYGNVRHPLEAELAADEVTVPVMQLARGPEGLRTICAWQVGQPVVLPRCDFVLVRRERTQKGLIWSRRVIEEGLVTGARIWDILAPFSEIRRDPVEVLIFREARKPPSQVAAAMEVLRLAPLEPLRRAVLADTNIVDFDLGPPPEAAPGSGDGGTA